MQSLSGKLASLNRFLAKSAERALPFFNTLKNITKENKHEYRWTPEAEEAFQQMKRLIMSLPSLTPPFPEETLYAYLAVSTEAVSAVLLTDRNGRQCPVQYVSRTLNEAERNYSPLEKLALSLVNMTQEGSGVEIGTYKISFMPRNAVKGQVLADFLSDAPDGEREDEYFQSPEVSPGIDDTEAWTLYTDGAASSKGSGLLFNWNLLERENNQKADVLSKLATVPFHHLTKEILVEVLNERSTEVQEVQTIVEEEGDNWMTPIIKYLEEGIDLFRQIMSFGKFTWDLGRIMYDPRALVRTQLNPVGRGKAAGQDNGQGDDPFRDGQHHMQIWSPKNHCHGQWRTTGMPSYRTLMIREEFNEEEQRLNLDLLQERREAAAIREARYKSKMEQYYNKKVRPAGFRPGEFVYRRNEASRVEDQGKLGPKWEGPYRLQNHTKMALTKLQTMEDKIVLDDGTRSTYAMLFSAWRMVTFVGRLGEEEHDTSSRAPGWSDEEDQKSFLRKDRSW
ncbi:reverse transcriptase domain-containing protein [Tanacetum coccineum]